jgi:hypothetical protein
MQSTQWAEGEKLTHASQYAEGYVETGSLDPNPIYASFKCSYSSMIIFTIFLLFLKVKDDLDDFQLQNFFCQQSVFLMLLNNLLEPFQIFTKKLQRFCIYK